MAQMLTLANVRADSKVVVMETCRGLLLGATLERLGGRMNGLVFKYSLYLFWEEVSC